MPPFDNLAEEDTLGRYTDRKEKDKQSVAQPKTRERCFR